MRWLTMLTLTLAACGGCEDAGTPVGGLGGALDMSPDAPHVDDGLTPDTSSDVDVDEGGDMGRDDVSTTDLADMPMKSVAPRDDVAFAAHDIIYQPRVSLFNIVPTMDAFYLATSSAGDAVTFSLGDPDELVLASQPLDSFGALWARYSNGLEIQAADQISRYPGGPLMGGTSNGDRLVVDDNGSRVMAGAFFGSIDFGGTVWSTNFSDTSGALTTSSGGYVVRATDNTVQGMFRLRTSSASSNTSITGLVVHENDDVTIAGPMSDEVIFPDDSRLTSGRGFVARTNSGGTPAWSTALPSLPYLTDAGDRTLVRFTYREAFTLGTSSYPAPSTGFGVALVAIDANGEVDWIHRIEAPPSMAYIREPRVFADGTIAVPFRAENETALDMATPPDPAGKAHLWVLNADGTLVWSTTLQGDLDTEVHSVALDHMGVIWATAGICEPGGSTIRPVWADPINISPCDPSAGPTTWVLLGLDSDDGSIGFAHALFRGSASVDDVEVLSNGAVVVGAHYFDPTTVLPNTVGAFEIDQLGTGANDLNGLLLLFE